MSKSSHPPASPNVGSIQAVRLVPETAPLVFKVEVELAPHIPSCCGVADGAAIEIHAEGFYQRLDLELEEHRSGHQLVGLVSLPRADTYGYRTALRILGRPVFQEGRLTVACFEKKD